MKENNKIGITIIIFVISISIVGTYFEIMINENSNETFTIKYSTIKDIVIVRETPSENVTIFIMSNGDIVVYPHYDYNNNFTIGKGYVYSTEYIVGQIERR